MSGFGTFPFGTTSFGAGAGAGDTGAAAAVGATATVEATAIVSAVSASVELTATAGLVGRDIAALRAAADSSATLSTSAVLLSELVADAEASVGVRIALSMALAADAGASVTLTEFYRQVAAMYAVAIAIDGTLTSKTTIGALTAEATVMALLARGIDADAAVDAEAAVEVASLLHGNATLIAAAVAEAFVGNSITFVALLDVEADAEAVGDATARLVSMLEAGADAAVFLRLGGEEYTAWAMNLDNVGVTQYQNYGFNSFATRGDNVHLGAREDGLYVLEGDDDNGEAINAWFRTGLMNFGTGSVKRMPACYIGYTAENGLVLKVVVTNDGVKDEHWFKFTPRQADAAREDRAVIGKGLASVYWQFELHNIDGGDFDISAMRLWPMVLTRRVR